ncbi:UNVERIFIED_CONTAM: hypothetical protein OHV15_19275, partial [Microbacterium sp. SLM126]
ARAELKRRYDAETADGSRWFWQGDGSDHLESMVNGMQVIIGAAELRQLLASTASDSGETREPIYQVRNLDGHWIDINKRHYEARISRRFTGEARILYAAPAATRAQGAVTLTPAMREHLMAGIMALSELQRDNPWIANTKAILAAPAQGASDA